MEDKPRYYDYHYNEHHYLDRMSEREYLAERDDYARKPNDGCIYTSLESEIYPDIDELMKGLEMDDILDIVELY